MKRALGTRLLHVPLAEITNRPNDHRPPFGDRHAETGCEPWNSKSSPTASAFKVDTEGQVANIYVSNTAVLVSNILPASMLPVFAVLLALVTASGYCSSVYPDTNLRLNRL